MPKFRAWKKPHYKTKALKKITNDKKHKDKEYQSYLKRERDIAKLQKKRQFEYEKQKAIKLQHKRMKAEQTLLYKLYNNQMHPQNLENSRDGVHVVNHGRLDPRFGA
jgi:hypothetical protein